MQLLLFASFTCFDLPTATRVNLGRFINVNVQEGLQYLPQRWQQEVTDNFPILLQRMPDVRYSPYVPMAPAALFLGYVLGLPLGFFAAIGFFLLALVGPYIGVLPVAGGGGLEYYRQATFGYLIGVALAAWFAGRVTMTENNSARQIAVVAGGLLILHLCGLTYLVGSSLGILLFEGEGAYLRWQPWLAESIRNYSWYSLPYDALFGLAAIGIGFPFRWLTSVLTAPDIAMRGRPKWDERLDDEDEQVELGQEVGTPV